MVARTRPVADMPAVGMSNYTCLLRPVAEGTIHAAAKRLHRDRSTWLWEVSLEDGEGKLCAALRVTPSSRSRPSEKTVTSAST